MRPLLGRVSKEAVGFVFEISIEGGYENLKIAFHCETHFVPSSCLSSISFPTLSHTIMSSVFQTYSRLPTIDQVIRRMDGIT